MQTIQSYPVMEINLKHLKENAENIVSRCKECDIKVTGVVKAVDTYKHGYNEIAKLLLDSGCVSIGDSRMNTIRKMREDGFEGELMLIRIPMKSELEEVVRYADITLQSEMEVIKLTNEAAEEQKVMHGVLLMMDLGDLREGFFDEEELIEAALYIEHECSSLRLKGIGTNLGCYGAISPDNTNLGRLVGIARKIEEKIDRKLDYVSGGATSTLPLVLKKQVPEGINHLRIGEGIVVSRDLIDDWKCEMPFMNQDIYRIKAEVIEVKTKASHPIGKIFIDAFGNTPQFEDKGMRKRALLALGKRDVGSFDYLKVRLEGAEILGGSSDHLILDVEEVPGGVKVGDIIGFDCTYGAMVFANHSESVSKVYLR